jgi:hypothetical protein
MDATYICEWERLDSPTRGMTAEQSKDYYKAHAIAGDCAFALRPGSSTPEDIRAGWLALQAAIAGKRETPAHKAIRDGLRKAWRTWADGRPYTVPMAALPVTKARKATQPGCCPTCGAVREAVAA